MADKCLIGANPDIAGIGVRTSIYVQAFVAVISSTIRFVSSIFREEPESRNKFDKDLIAISKSASIVLFTGIALIISGAIQAATFGLSPYHTIIMLNLSAITVVFAIVPYFFIFFILWFGKKSLSGAIGSFYSSSNKMVRAGGRLFALHTLHVSSIAGFGLWLFISLPHFGPSPPYCASSTIYDLFGHQVPLDNAGLRIFSMIIFGILAIPVVNVTIIAISILLTSVALMLPLQVFFFRVPLNMIYGTAMFVIFNSSFFLIIGLVVTVNERTILANTVASGESQWTLGQTLALFVALASLKDLWEALHYERNINQKVIMVCGSTGYGSKLNEIGNVIAGRLAEQGLCVICQHSYLRSHEVHESQNLREGWNSVGRGLVIGLKTDIRSADFERIYNSTVSLFLKLDCLILLEVGHMKSKEAEGECVEYEGAVVEKFWTHFQSAHAPEHLMLLSTIDSDDYNFRRRNPYRIYSANVHERNTAPISGGDGQGVVIKSLPFKATGDKASDEALQRILFMLKQGGWVARLRRRKYGKELETIGFEPRMRMRTYARNPFHLVTRRQSV